MSDVATAQPNQPSTISVYQRLSFTIREAADVTGLTVRKLEGAIARGELKAKVIGNTAVISASALKRLVGEE